MCMSVKLFLDPGKITAGVRQGSHLGLILFLVFINDLPESVNIGNELFADMLLHKEYRASEAELHHQAEDLQAAITNAEIWASSWGGKFSHKKAGALPLASRQKIVDNLKDQLSTLLFVDGYIVLVVADYKRFGVFISGDLCWKSHVRDMVARCSRKAGLLKWMFPTFPEPVMTRLYLHYLRPALDYAAPVWHGSLLASEAAELKKMQKLVARSILKVPWDTSSKDLLRALDWNSLR